MERTSLYGWMQQSYRRKYLAAAVFYLVIVLGTTVNRWTVIQSEVPGPAQQSVRSALLTVTVMSILAGGLVFVVIASESITSLDRLADRANDMEEGDLEVAFETHKQDEVGQIYGSLAAMRDALRERVKEVEQAREEAQADAKATREEAETRADRLQEQAEKLDVHMQAAAAGDFTQRLDENATDDIMQTIAFSFNDMMDDLEETIALVQRFADQVADSSQEITASAEVVEYASEDVSTAVQNIADGASRQNETLQETADEMTDISATIEEIASSSAEVAETTEDAADLGTAGSELASRVGDEMEAIESKAELAMTEVEQLDEHMAQIGEIVGVITDIANQTNILALNASIEAARAGEAGDGFAVVANDVKRLAEETQEATQDIEARIEEAKEATDSTVVDMREMGERLADGTETVDDAVQILEQIIDRVEDANEGVQSINDATDEQAQSTDQIVSMIEEAESVSQTTAEEAQSVATSAEQQTSSTSEVTARIESLSDRSGKLSEILTEFEVTTTDVKYGEIDMSGVDMSQTATDD